MSLTSVNKTETNTVELEIAISAADFNAAVDEAFKKNAPKMNIPGFRKGKAPRKMIEKMYGEGVFYEEVTNNLYPKAYQEAAIEAKIEPVDRADVEILSVDKETGVTFKAIVTVKPEVTVKEYKGIAAKKVMRPATEEEVTLEISRLQERNGRIITIEDRPAQLSDEAVIDFEGYIDGETFEGGKGDHFALKLGSNQFIPGFEEQVVGHNPGEEFDVNVVFPEDYHMDELKGVETLFKVKLHEIKNKELPELDDEFAKDVSPFDTMAELRTDIKSKIQQGKDNKSQEDVENALIEEITNNMTVEIPAVMIQSRIDGMMGDFEYRLKQQGMTLDIYLQYTGMSMDAFRKTFDEQASRQVKIRLALEKIVELESIAVTEEELGAELERMSAHYKMDVEKIKSVVPVREIEKDLAVNKAVDFIKDNAVITEISEEQEAVKPAEEVSEEKPKKTTKRVTKAKKTDEE